MDLAFVFGLSHLIHNDAVRVDSGMLKDDVSWSEDDIVFADYVITLWTNFAKYGYTWIDRFIHFKRSSIKLIVTEHLKLYLLTALGLPGRDTMYIGTVCQCHWRRLN